jgi:hypothetical protein
MSHAVAHRTVTVDNLPTAASEMADHLRNFLSNGG